MLKRFATVTGRWVAAVRGHRTGILDVAGLGLLVAGVAVTSGTGAALLAAGVSLLWVAWEP